MKLRSSLKICRDIVREFSLTDYWKKGDQRILINYSKTMNHNCDVIDLYFNEGAQKSQTESQKKSAEGKVFLKKFSALLGELRGQ